MRELEKLYIYGRDLFSKIRRPGTPRNEHLVLSHRILDAAGCRSVGLVIVDEIVLDYGHPLQAAYLTKTSALGSFASLLIGSESR